ncbi:ribonuclease P protein component [Anaerotignum sp. MB30-C6]|uniref:ribonuclease P protein component n=1 Tax=Anaerotignum sp. MB30-C6 TaxID=3070814 RepID=UPI0027DABD0F|nr:ribonuclease P protein component [Anaerotignum sp. MB30-C6]WMI81146.1 ribonuclease P protein component [Anaerotignum sp. MB30-C6]
MKFTESLKKNFQFRYVYNRGRSIANRHLVMYVVRNGTQGNKLGISVSKKVGKSVVRSHVTRLIKESYRNMEEDLKSGYDIVVIARVICNDSTYQEVNTSLRHLLKKHHLFLSHQEKDMGKEGEKEAR